MPKLSDNAVVPTRRNERERAGRWSAGLFVTLLLAGCGHAPPSSSAAPVPTQSAPRPVVRPGDAVRVDVWREADMSGQYAVDDRGIITLPLLGDRHVAGLEPPELRDRLIGEYREYIQNPSVSITVLRRVTILGEVGQPGLYQLDATISLSQALGMAGGILSSGNPDDIRVIRGDTLVQSGLDEALAVGAIDVRSGDQIFVGQQSWLARNSSTILGSLLGAATGITIALVR